MKIIPKIIIACFSLVLFHASFAASAGKTDLSPIGFWKTIDDVTGKPKAIVQLWETPDQMLYGKVLKVFPRPGQEQSEFCTACEGAKRNQRIIGLVILENLKQNKNEATSWDGGTILDPKNGKTYHSKLQVVDAGRKLNVKGYIGAPLFGRTQTWVRVAEPATA